MEKNLKSIRKQFREKGVFYTPPELVQFMKQFLPENISEVYDPTCGSGGLLRHFGDDVKKYGQELDPIEADKARSIPNSSIATGDTLETPAFLDKRFKAIIANPPFGIKWNASPEKRLDARFQSTPVLAPPSKADYAFVLHCLHLLADDGTAVIMGSPGILYRGNTEGKIRAWLVVKNYVDCVVHISGNKFTDTSIATCLVVLKKNRQTTDVLFIDSENDIERTVPLSEIESKDYSLSVSQYVEKPVIKEEIDVKGLECEARSIVLNNLKSGLSLSLLACEVGLAPDDPPFMELLRDVRAVIDTFEQKYLELSLTKAP